jgi:hypothetical protein
MKCWYSAFNAEGLRLIIVVVHVGAVKIYVAYIYMNLNTISFLALVGKANKQTNKQTIIYSGTEERGSWLLSWVPKPRWNLGVRARKCLEWYHHPHKTMIGCVSYTLTSVLTHPYIIRALFQFKFWVPHFHFLGKNSFKPYLDSITNFFIIIIMIWCFFFSAAVKSATLNPEKHVPCAERQLAWKNSFTHTHTHTHTQEVPLGAVKLLCINKNLYISDIY